TYFVTALPVYNQLLNASVCIGSNYKGFTIHADTNIVQHLFTKNNCDSTITNVVKALSNPVTIVNASRCKGTLYNGITINNDTIFSGYYIGSNGCDSIVNYHVQALQKTLRTINASICA